MMIGPIARGSTVGKPPESNEGGCIGAPPVDTSSVWYKVRGMGEFLTAITFIGTIDDKDFN